MAEQKKIGPYFFSFWRKIRKILKQNDLANVFIKFTRGKKPKEKFGLQTEFVGPFFFLVFMKDGRFFWPAEQEFYHFGMVRFGQFFFF